MNVLVLLQFVTFYLTKNNCTIRNLPLIKIHVRTFCSILDQVDELKKSSFIFFSFCFLVVSLIKAIRRNNSFLLFSILFIFWCNSVKNRRRDLTFSRRGTIKKKTLWPFLSFFNFSKNYSYFWFVQIVKKFNTWSIISCYKLFLCPFKNIENHNFFL